MRFFNSTFHTSLDEYGTAEQKQSGEPNHSNIIC
jgi:hypothetical protein